RRPRGLPRRVAATAAGGAFGQRLLPGTLQPEPRRGQARQGRDPRPGGDPAGQGLRQGPADGDRGRPGEGDESNRQSGRGEAHGEAESAGAEGAETEREAETESEGHLLG